MLWLCLAFLCIHILLCLFTCFAIRAGVLKVHFYMFWVTVFLPFWGFLIVLILHFQILLKGDNKRDISIEKMQLESDLYRSVVVDEKKNSDSVIPMEEALIINSPHERRELIMDVLNDNPKEYIEFLQKAGDNDDTEVVHYAVTAMVEISKENDYMLQKLERRYSQTPDDYGVLTEYCEFLRHCLEQRLMQGQVEVMNRNLFNELMKKKLAQKETAEDYIELIKNYLELKLYSEAGAAISRLEALSPDEEEIILLKLEYYAAQGRGEDIKKLLFELEKNNVYLSARVKEAVAFWKV